MTMKVETESIDSSEEFQCRTKGLRRRSAFQKIVEMEQLDVMNLIQHPVWILDTVALKNRWANTTALQFWEAESVEEFAGRDLSDISPTARARNQQMMNKIELGENVEEQWTFYPKGKSAKTVNMTMSGIRLSIAPDYFCFLVYAVPVTRDNLVEDTLRGVEMLRHLPMPVCQFDMFGHNMFQNPAADLPISFSEKEDDESKESSNDANPAGENGIPRRDSSKDFFDVSQRSFASSVDGPRESYRTNVPFQERFADPKVALRALETIRKQDEYSLYATLYTRNGPRWSAVQLRKTNDPVTSQPVILFSSRDKSDAVKAKQERIASQQRTEFLAIMAHEIRTPLHQVTGFIDLLAQTTLTPEQRSYTKLLKSSAEGLMTVISDVLDYSKLEAGKMKIEKVPYEPLSVVQGTMAAVRGSCEEKGLDLTMDWCKKLPYRVNGDPNRLRQVLLNLLSNAIKFTKQGNVHLQVRTRSEEPIDSANKSTEKSSSSSPSWMKFMVKDTGVGISDEHEDSIFEKYNQGNLSTARNTGGTGLGLSICKLLVTNMGGKIGVDSTLGKGSTFWFELPIQEAFHTSQHLKDEVVPLKDDKPKEGLNVLVAEDNLVNQKLVAKMLQRMGHKPTIAENGQVAIEMIENGSFDVVLMDIQMPVMDGLEATRRLRAMGFSELPILGLTASVKRSDFAELGFDDWIPKPIPMKKLKSLLEQFQQKRDMPKGDSQ